MIPIQEMARAALEQQSHDWRCRRGEPRAKRLRYDIFQASSAEKQMRAALAEARCQGWQLVQIGQLEDIASACEIDVVQDTVSKQAVLFTAQVIRMLLSAAPGIEEG